MPSLAVSASGENDIAKDDIRWYRNLEERIAKEHRKLSRMKYGSANYWQQKHRIGKLHEKAANRRNDFLHKLSRKVSDSFDAVVVEDINLQHMSQALNFGKAVYDNGYGRLRNMLLYKLDEQGKVLVKVDRFFPSSKRCSVCQEVNHNLSFQTGNGRAAIAARTMTGTGTQQKTCWMREKTSYAAGPVVKAH